MGARYDIGENETRCMRVAVLGGGVVGVVTAWYLVKEGHAVTVFDRAEGVACGTSHANAGQLSYSFTDALARPEFLRRLPSVLLGCDPGIAVRAKTTGSLVRWGSAFIRECTAARARDNTISVLRLAMRSAALMEQLMAELPLEFSFSRAGKLVLLSRQAELEAAARSIALKEQYGCSTELLRRDDVLQLEPSLAFWRDEFIAAIWSSNDHVADARSFTVGLAKKLEMEHGVLFCLGETVTGLGLRHGRARTVITEKGVQDTDAVVVCLGAESGRLLRALGIRLPICPVRGYSITLPAGRQAPSISVSHAGHRIVLSRLGHKLRIAGFADFAGFDTRDDRLRTDTLLRLARRIAPLAADYASADLKRWGGDRPMTPDGRPRVGPSKIPGLFLNTGHGMLGWTLACATGQTVAESIG
ncbi:MAG: FAD-dependent oxidoreductase [Woeseia sp.]